MRLRVNNRAQEIALAPFAALAASVVPGHGDVGSDASQGLDADRTWIAAVMASGDSDDARIENDAMLEMHRRLQRLMQ
ncbi:hypothetical protein [Humidisolicoccus flavus]|uniref:hypothetical protein n=1 Tax=Humidisolicoccus flavus TaxID=3111414 RepID=UPI00324C215D